MAIVPTKQLAYGEKGGDDDENEGGVATGGRAAGVCRFCLCCWASARGPKDWGIESTVSVARGDKYSQCEGLFQLLTECIKRSEITREACFTLKGRLI